MQNRVVGFNVINIVRLRIKETRPKLRQGVKSSLAFKGLDLDLRIFRLLGMHEPFSITYLLVCLFFRTFIN